MRGVRAAASRRGAALAAYAISLAAVAAPYRPQDDALVLERIPPGASAAVLERARRSGDVAVAVRLARSFIERARQAGDPRLLGYAEGLLQPWEAGPQAQGEVLLLRATIRQSRHDFDGALADLDRVLAGNPGSQQGWLTRATVLRVQGRYAEAMDACLKVQELARASLVEQVCVAGVRSLTGDLGGSIERMRALVPLAQRQEGGLQAWFLSEFADQLERGGVHDAADEAYRRGLQITPEDSLLIGAYADFLLDRGRHADALRLLGGRRGEALALRRLIAQRHLGEVDADDIETLSQAYAAARRRGDGAHRREEGRFELEVRGNPVKALELSLENWKVQREPADVRLVLACATAAASPRSAWAVAQWWRSQGAQDIRIAKLLERFG